MSISREQSREYEWYFSADTGAARTVLADRVYQQIPEDRRPRLNESMSTPLTSVTGDTLRERGRGTFSIQLGSLKLVQQIIVANIEDDCLLGLDVLMKSDLGPADIKLSENKVLLNGIDIPCTKISTDKVVRTVRAIDDVIIPAQSERIVDVMIDFPENDVSDETLDISSHDYIIEPSPQFQQNYNLDMASTLVNDRDREFVPVRILNTQKTDVTIKQHDIIGEAEICEGDRIVKVLDAENESEDHNFFAIRRLQFHPGQGHDLHTTDRVPISQERDKL